MNYQLLEMLVCPDDRHFPLQVNKPFHSPNSYPFFSCDSYCARERDFIREKIPESQCRECSKERIEKASLTCYHCGREFEVKEGIPRLFPLYPESSEEKIKQKEIRSRDKQAPSYDRLKLLALLSRIEKPLTLKLLGLEVNERVLELGSGTGRFTVDLSEKGRDVVAVDFSRESLKRCRQKFKTDRRIHLLQADITCLPLRDEIFDKVGSFQVFEHLPSSLARKEAISEVRRVLKRQGTFVISAYRYFWFSGLFGKKEGFHRGEIYFYRFTVQEFKEMLGAAFTIKEFHSNVGNYLQMAKCLKND